MHSESVEPLAEHSGLKPIWVRPPLGAYLRETWVRRDFIWTLAVLTREQQNARTRLGGWWTLLLPLIQSSVYGIIFGLILGSSRAPNFIPFLVAGVFLFTFVSGSFSTGASSITSNQGLLNSINFPRIVLPLSVVVRQFLNLLPTLPILLVVSIIFDRAIKWELLYLPLILALLLLFGFGAALIAARITVEIRDLNKLVPFVTRVLFYVSGVFFSPESLGVTDPVFVAFIHYNPVYAFLSLGRGAFVDGYEVTLFDWAVAGGWTLVVLVVGVIFFWRAEDRYGE